MKGPFAKNIITQNCSHISCTLYLTEALPVFMNFVYYQMNFVNILEHTKSSQDILF